MKHNCAFDELVDIHKVQPNPENNNRHSVEQIKRLAKIIDYQGQRSPIVVSKRTGFIVKGHCRLEAIRELGWDKVAVDFQDYENEAQEYADMTADNEIARWAELDMHSMYTKIEQFPDLDVDLLGLENFELPKVDVLDPEKEDDVPEVLHDPITRKGDVWLLGDHRVMCGDSTMIDDVEKLMKGEKADMVFTDPPYGDNHAAMELTPASERKGTHDIKKKSLKIKNDTNIEFLSEVSVNMNQFLKEGFAAFVFFKWNKWEKIKEYFGCFGEPKTVCVWDRDSQGASTFRINPVHEFCFYWGTLGDKKEVGNLRNVWRCRKELENKKLHPTVKPIEIIETPIRMCCEKGGLIIDYFLGSGSTLIACEKTNRKCYGMELDEHYCDVIITRYQQFTNKDAVLESTGETYKSIYERERNN